MTLPKIVSAVVAARTWVILPTTNHVPAVRDTLGPSYHVEDVVKATSADKEAVAYVITPEDDGVTQPTA